MTSALWVMAARRHSRSIRSPLRLAMTVGRGPNLAVRPVVVVAGGPAGLVASRVEIDVMPRFPPSPRRVDVGGCWFHGGYVNRVHRHHHRDQR
jgi:hypothetical protein